MLLSIIFPLLTAPIRRIDIEFATSWNYPAATHSCVVWAYTAVTLMLLGELDSNPPDKPLTWHWCYIGDILEKFSTYSESAVGPGKKAEVVGRNARQDYPRWIDSSFALGIRSIASLAQRQTLSSIENMRNSDIDVGRWNALVLMESTLVHIKEELGETRFEADDGMVWSFREALGKVRDAKATSKPSGHKKEEGP